MDDTSIINEEAGSSPQSDWLKLQEQQSALFLAATSEAEGLRHKVKDLEREVSVWKLAHSVVSDEKDATSKKASRLEHEIGKWTSDNPLVVALIDGDGHLFTQELFEMGQAGGRQAAMLIREALFNHITDENPGIANRAELLLTIFWNARGLRETLSRKGICTGDQFDGFCYGFNQSAHLFSIVDAGPGKEAADTKIKEHLRLFAHFPQTEFVFFGGGHDNGYTAALTSLETEGLLRKVVLIRGYSDLAQEIKHLNLRELSMTGVFMTNKLLSSPFKAAGKVLPDVHPPLHTPSSSSSDMLSPAEANSPSSGFDHLQLSPTKPRSQYTTGKRPCNVFYLHPKGCLKKSCQFAHDMELSNSTIDSMQANAQRTPCTFANQGKQCTDKHCIWGHYCPGGTQCGFLNKPGGCKFRGYLMHSKPKQNGLDKQSRGGIDSLGLHSIHPPAGPFALSAYESDVEYPIKDKEY